ncbi:GNAT family N-acetyltransferase [Streptomyces anulatus]|uniref:GNAT family N-acetyltransferase n=1 Tax=Streptomyces anulatus TaxID=1892 RepID=UPI0022558525|nr:GNAT family N-acetyltransferase [Streptomyces anulatus]MCX4486350.1 GNAT family N-acetyltransferase [Streptomyces anulatus]WSU78483.1 GNAT family N-acetyltransferase [Streptomyces anulatus]
MSQRSFVSPGRFAEGLDHWTARPGWSCVVGYDGDQPVGYTYGAPLPPGSRWWGGLLTDVPADVTTETGTRTYALSELMVRTPWRKTGVARQLHSAVLATRREERATLLVDQTHPKVHALYESWGGPPLETSAPAWRTLRSSTPCCSASPRGPGRSGRESEPWWSDRRGVVAGPTVRSCPGRVPVSAGSVVARGDDSEVLAVPS